MTKQRSLLGSLIIVSLVFVPSSTAAQAKAPRVYLEVLTDKGSAIDAPQRWLQMLRDLPLASIRLRQKRAGESFDIQREGGPASQQIRVRAVLGADGILRVPNHRFRLSDQRRLKQWIEELEADPETSGKNAPVVFGMTAQQLDRTMQGLSPPVRMKTKGMQVARLIEHIRSRITIPIAIDAGVAAWLRDDQLIDDELSGLSCGTALAAAIRPLGLALAPAVGSDGTLKVDIVNGRTAKEQWPVGWQTDARERDAIPKLFDTLRVEIVDTPFPEALQAIQNRLQVPILLDHRAAKAKEIVPAEVKVRFPAKRTFYKRVLERVLFQAGLKAEFRADESNRPFIWLTPI